MLLLLACTPDTIDLDTATGPSIVAAPAFDPLAGPAWTFTSAEEGTAKVVDSAGKVVRSALPATGWDGRDDAGNLVSTGDYRVTVGEAETTLSIVRAGLVAAYAEDDGGSTALRVPLYWHRAGKAQSVTEAFTAVDTIDASGGVTPLPNVGDSLGVPETGGGEPLAYRWDSRPIVAVQFGSQSELGASNLDSVALSLVVDGWTVIGGEVSSGSTVTLQRDEALGSTLGVTDESIVATVTARSADGSNWPVIDVTVPLRVYRVLGDSTWYESGDLYRPWVAAVDPALRALEGTAPTRAAALDALVRWVYEDLELEYDTRYGASAYTVYVRNNWERAVFDMSSFIDRRFGSTVNCTDCAGIVVGYGNMIGALSEYAIIGYNFDLNYILAIGGEEFTHCPFGNGGCGFSYHAVTVSETLDAVWDATLALDGDADPGSSPSEVLMVQTIDPDEYLDRLAATRADYDATAQGELQ